MKRSKPMVTVVCAVLVAACGPVFADDILMQSYQPNQPSGSEDYHTSDTTMIAYTFDPYFTGQTTTRTMLIDFVPTHDFTLGDVVLPAFTLAAGMLSPNFAVFDSSDTLVDTASASFTNLPGSQTNEVSLPFQHQRELQAGQAFTLQVSSTQTFLYWHDSLTSTAAFLADGPATSVQYSVHVTPPESLTLTTPAMAPAFQITGVQGDVPEPASIALIGLAGLALLRRRG